MSKVKGIVSGTGKGKYSYFIRLDGDPVYYNTKYEPKCSEGDTVGLEFVSKGDTRANIQKVVILEKGSGGGGGGFKSPAPGGGGGGDRQDSIVCQHSQEMAVRYLDILVSNGGVKISGQPDAKKTQLDELLGELTVHFFNEAMDFRNSAAFKTGKELEEDFEETPPEEDAGDDDPWGEWEN